MSVEGGDAGTGPVEGAARGGGGGFREIFRRYHGGVWRVAYSRLGNAADADEAAADTFVRLHRAIRRYRRRDGATFDAFVVKVADRAAIDLHRRRRRHTTQPLGDDV